MLSFLNDIKKTVIFLGKRTPPAPPVFEATASLFEFNSAFHLVTAKHVVVDPKTGAARDQDLNAYFNSTQPNQIMERSIDQIKAQLQVNWIFHTNPMVDIAVIPFGLNPQTDDVKTIPVAAFLSPNQLEELQDVFFLSYQPGIEPTQRIVPVIRTGTVSIINNDKTFYLDAFAFPGNSGSPVFIKPIPARITGKGIEIGDPLGGKFIGIIGEYLPYREVAVSLQTGNPRVIFEENTGLAKVWPFHFVSDIVSSQPFKEQMERILEAAKSVEAASVKTEEQKP